MNYSGVIFDLDGTLIDTIDDIADSMNCALGALGLPLHPAGAYKIFVGNGVDHLVREALAAAGGSDGFFERAREMYIEKYNANLSNKTRPYDGVTELLGEFSARGVRIAVLSNKPHDATLGVVREFFPDIRFDAVFGQREGVRRKPYPDGAVEIADTLKISPERFLYLGDTDVDMRTAKGAGMVPIGALWGFRDAEELTGGGAKALIERPMELLALIEG